MMFYVHWLTFIAPFSFAHNIKEKSCLLKETMLWVILKIASKIAIANSVPVELKIFALPSYNS